MENELFARTCRCNLEKGRLNFHKTKHSIAANVALFLLAAILIVPAFAYAQNDDRLVVKGSDGLTTTFSVQDVGTLYGIGNDGVNNFKYRFMSHAGGALHTQLVTDDFNSRISIMASDGTDEAPRLAMVGPQDATERFRGFAFFDFGSNLYSLPAAQYQVRHYDPSEADTILEVFSLVGRQYAVFPAGNVGIGTPLDTAPTARLQVNGTIRCTLLQETSSRELKENIVELNANEALEAIKNITPVKYNFKEFKEEASVGFIAEDVPDLVANNDRKTISSLDIVAVLTKVVQEQQKTIDQLNEKMARFEGSLQKQE